MNPKKKDIKKLRKANQKALDAANKDALKSQELRFYRAIVKFIFAAICIYVMYKIIF